MLGLQVSAMGWAGAWRIHTLWLAVSAFLMATSTFVGDQFWGSLTREFTVGVAAAGIAWLPNIVVGKRMLWPCLPVTRAERLGSAKATATACVLAVTVGVQGVGMLVNGRLDPSILLRTTVMALMVAWACLGMYGLVPHQGRAGRRPVTHLGTIGFGILLVIYGVLLPVATLLDRSRPGGSMLLLAAAYSSLGPATIAGPLLGTRWGPRGPLSWMPVRPEQARLWAALASGAVGIPFLATHLYLRAEAEGAAGAPGQLAPVSAYLAAGALWFLLPAIALAPPSWGRARASVAVLLAFVLTLGLCLTPVANLLARFGRLDAATATAAPFLAGALLLTSVVVVAKR